MSQKAEPDLKKIRCIQLATRKEERSVQLSIDQLSKQTTDRNPPPALQNLLCDICGFIPQGEIVECTKCDKLFCKDCLDQYQYRELKKKQKNGERDINPNNEAVQKMECPKFHIFYGYTPLDYRDGRDAYGLPHGPQPSKPRKKLNQHVQTLLLEQFEFVHWCTKCGPNGQSKTDELGNKAAGGATSANQIIQSEPAPQSKTKAKNNKRIQKQIEKELEALQKDTKESKDKDAKDQGAWVTLKYKDHIEHMKTSQCQIGDIRFKCPYDCPECVAKNVTFTSDELTQHLINDCEFAPMRCAICKKSLKGHLRKDKTIKGHTNNHCIEHIKQMYTQRERKTQEIKNHNTKIEEGINMQQQSRPMGRMQRITTEIMEIKQKLNHEEDNLKNQLNSQIQNLQRWIKPYIVNVRNKQKQQKAPDSIDPDVKGGLTKYDIEVPDNWTEGDYGYDTSNEEEKQAEDGVQDDDDQIQTR